MAELRPYNPTIRDRIASALMGQARPGSARANMVEGMMGSRGIGTTGMGLADLTPLGIPMAGQEAQRDAQSGNYIGAAANAMAVIPAAKAPIQAAKGVATEGIRAYHGSPYSFDRFDLSKIGTGEGAQAYGHGLYFAENEKVAREYRDALAGKAANPDRNRQLSELARQLDQYAIPGQYGKYNSPEGYKLKAEYDRIMQERAADKGSMYEVNIRANPDQFLDWDRPLGEQPRAVQKLFPLDVYGHKYGEMTGADVYESMIDKVARARTNKIVSSLAPSDRTGATEMLRGAGVPGIRYLDGGSRGAGEGSRNYVVFDDKLIDIVRKYGLAGLMMGGLGAGAMGGAPGLQYQAAPPQL